MKLEGKTIIVAGAGPGIGEGIVTVLTSEGADIAVVDLHQNEADRIAEDVRKAGRRAVAISADLTDEDECKRMVKEALDGLGEIDGLANTVGGPGSVPGAAFPNTSAAHWEDLFKLNLMSCIFICQAIAPYFMERRNGSIVNTASVCGNTYDSLGAYCCSKAAVQHFSKSLSRTLAPYNVNVNILNPGNVFTPNFMARNVGRMRKGNPDLFVGKTDLEFYEEMCFPRIPLKRLQTPEDMGHLVAFLLSDEAMNITGQSMYVDGGEYLG